MDEINDLWSVRLEENEYVVRLVVDKLCDNEECSCHNDGYVTQYTTIAKRKKIKEPPEPGSLEEKQLVWILKKIKGKENLGDFPQ